MTQIKAVLFDMDGVLIDARDWHYRALNDGLEPFGENIGEEEHIARFDGLPTRVKLDMLEADGRLPKFLHKFVEDIKQERTLREAATLCFPVLDHLMLLSWLKQRGLKIGVATNSIRKSSETMLEFAGLFNKLDCLVTNQDVENAKPAPDIYLRGCEILEVRPEETLVVEDSEYGVRAATAAKCRVVRVENPTQVHISLIQANL